MNLKINSLAALIGVAAACAAHASPEQAALDACASAFATRLAAPGAAPPSFKVVLRSNPEPVAPTDLYSHEYMFYLRADDKKTGLPIARASCSTDARGTVLELSATVARAARQTAATGL